MDNRTKSNPERSDTRPKRKGKSARKESREAAMNPSLPKVLEQIREERRERPTGFLCTVSENFRRWAAATSRAMGSAWTFAIALVAVIVWAATGPIFHYSETWQLVINTGTTIITFLMIFLVQNSQNRDSRAIQLKLDELLRGVKGARTAMVDLEDATDEELEKLQAEFERLRREEEVPRSEEAEEANEEKEARP